MTERTLTPPQRVKAARAAERPNITDYIEALFTEFFPLSGDRKHGEDGSILGGLALFHGMPITVIGHRKGRNLEENLKYRFGMPNPEGYRKAERLFLQAEKFGRPVITFIDTPGAYPGMEAEAGGQGEAIARCLATMSSLEVPTIAVLIGEGGSGGALALAVADRLILLENSIFSVLSPEGFASILWKDSSKWEEASKVMKLTAYDLISLGVGDAIVKEPVKGIGVAPEIVYEKIDQLLLEYLKQLQQTHKSTLVKNRYKRLRLIGSAKGKDL